MEISKDNNANALARINFINSYRLIIINILNTLFGRKTPIGYDDNQPFHQFNLYTLAK